MLIVHSDQAVRVESYRVSVLDKYIGDAIYGCRDHELVAEVDTLGIGGDVPIEVSASLRTGSKMSFADSSDGAAHFFRHIDHDNAGDVDDWLRISGDGVRVFLSPRAHTCQESKTGRDIGGGSRVGVDELHVLSGKTAGMGSTDLCRPITAKVTYTRVAREYVNSARFL